MSFVGYLILAKPPLILVKLLRLALKHFYQSFEALSTFFKVNRILTLAPHEVHPYHSSERRYLPSWR